MLSKTFSQLVLCMSAAVVSMALAAPASSSRTLSGPLAKRSDIAHDDVVGFSTTVPSGTEGTLMLQYQPRLYVVNGCVPFPAVDASEVKQKEVKILTVASAGLAPSGLANGDCDSSTGQVYSRAGSYGSYYLIMYSWYMPKDIPNILEGAVGIGHRHDWENVVVVLASQSTSASLVGLAASYHGDYETCSGTGCSSYLSGNYPRIRYYSAGSVLDHSLGFTTTVGGTQPLIAWASLPAVARTALTNKDWGDAIVPFLDSNFDSYLAEAATALGL
ncbi:hypothetical protein DV738_g4043, partial [Chaetothyriales sp. CBS 135597]